VWCGRTWAAGLWLQARVVAVPGVGEWVGRGRGLDAVARGQVVTFRRRIWCINASGASVGCLYRHHMRVGLAEREREGRAEWKSASVQVTQETAGNFALRCCPSAYRQASKSELANLECLRPANLKT
jgi:hypothetical protein